MKKYSFEISSFLLLPFILLSHISEGTAGNTCNLNEVYSQGCNQPSDINEHLPVLCKYAKECSSAVEIGRNGLDATWGILQGLSENHSTQRTFLKIVTDYLTPDQFNLAKTLTEAHAITFDFWQAKDLFIHIEPTDMLFLENSRTYCHLTYELESFSSHVRKYICIHGTSGAWSHENGEEYYVNYSDYQTSYERIKATYDRTKKGLWPAVLDFLTRHPEWVLLEQITDNQGFTVLQRLDEAAVPGPISFPLVDHYLKNKMILCTGPSLGRYDMLKKSTEADLSIVPFKKIYVTTNEPQIKGISFCGRNPDLCYLIPNRGKHLDCVNCIISTMRHAVNDPDVLDDDIILFKHESVFINDTGLVKKAINKIVNEGYNMVIRNMAEWQGTAATDAFFVKVSAIREVVKDFSDVTELLPHAWFCELYFHHMIVNRVSNIFGIYYNHSNGDFTELGFYHYPSQPESTKHYWDRKNRDKFYDLPSYVQ